LETVGKGTFSIANGAGHKTNEGVGQNSGCEFSATQDIISNAEFHGDDLFSDPLVYAFVMATEEQ
jgi:hypothetical protein